MPVLGRMRQKRAKLDNLEGLGALRIHDLLHNVVSWDVSRADLEDLVSTCLPQQPVDFERPS